MVMLGLLRFSYFIILQVTSLGQVHPHLGVRLDCKLVITRIESVLNSFISSHYKLELTRIESV